MKFSNHRSRARVAAAVAVAIVGLSGHAFGQSYTFQPFSINNVTRTWQNQNLLSLQGGTPIPDDTYGSGTVTFSWTSTIPNATGAWSSEPRATFSSTPGTGTATSSTSLPTYGAGNIVYAPSATTLLSPTGGASNSQNVASMRFTFNFTNNVVVSGGVAPSLYMNMRQAFTPSAGQTVAWTGMTVTLTRATVFAPPTTLATLSSAGSFATNALTGGAVQWYRVDHAGGNLTLDTYGNSINSNDTALGLYSSAGTLVASNDTFAEPNGVTGETPVAALTSSNLASGTYYAAVAGATTSFGSTGFSVSSTSTRTGSVRLNVNSPFVPTPAVPTGAVSVSLGTATTQTLGTGATAWFTFNHAGGPLSLSTLGSSVSDTELALYSSNGTILGYNDDNGGGGLWSLIDSTNVAAGTYYAAVVPFNSSNALGNYFAASNRSTTTGTISFTASIPTPIAPPAGAIAVTDASTTGVSLSGTNVAWFSIAWPGGALTLDTVGSGLAPSNDTELGLYSSTGALIESDDDDGPDLLSLISRTNLASGTYYIALASYDATFATGFNVSTIGTNSGTGRLNVNFAVLPNGTWNNADGNWTDLSAWSGGFPVGSASIATFPDHGVLRTVTVPANVSSGVINFEGGNYIINGPGQIVMANGTARPEIYVFGGDPVINAPIRMPSTGMNFQIPGGSSLTVNRLVDTTLDLVSVVNVLAGGSLKLTGLAELGMFNIDPGGFVDFTTTGGSILGLRNPAGTVSTSTYYPQLVGRILEWWNNGARDGRGIGTSAANPFTTIGFIPNIDESGRVIFETYLGVTVFNDEFIMRATYLGDTNLDGVVNGVDLANLIEAYTIGGKTGWYNGDFNYDGVINEVDFGLFNAGFTGQGAPLGNGPIPVGGAIPEPSSLALLAPAALALTRKRRTNR